MDARVLEVTSGPSGTVAKLGFGLNGQAMKVPYVARTVEESSVLMNALLAKRWIPIEYTNGVVRLVA